MLTSPPLHSTWSESYCSADNCSLSLLPQEEDIPPVWEDTGAGPSSPADRFGVSRRPPLEHKNKSGVLSLTNLPADYSEQVHLKKCSINVSWSFPTLNLCMGMKIRNQTFHKKRQSTHDLNEPQGVNDLNMWVSPLTCLLRKIMNLIDFRIQKTLLILEWNCFV